jgi:hypothetical protein
MYWAATMAGERRCMVCGAAAVEAHHITGRDGCRVQFDPELTVDLCRSHHELVHEDLRDEDLDRVRRPLRDPERVAHRLQRLAVLFARAAGHPTDAWAQLASHLRAWADELLDDEQRCP